MNTFKQGDKVTITTANGVELAGTVIVRVLYAQDPASEFYSVRVEAMGESYTFPVEMIRLVASSSTTSKAIVEKLQLIEKLRKQVDGAFSDLIGLLANDGQPEYEQKKFEEMRITHKTMLHRDIAAERTAWEGYHEARKRG